MFSKLAFIATATLAIFVAALPQPGGNPTTVQQSAQSCGADAQQLCCEEFGRKGDLEKSGSVGPSAVAALLSVAAEVPIALQCLAVVGSSCNQQSVCCKDVSQPQNGVVNIATQCTALNA